MKIEGIKSIEVGIKAFNREIAIVTLENEKKRLYYKSSKGTRSPRVQGSWSQFHGNDMDGQCGLGKGWFIKCSENTEGFTAPGESVPEALIFTTLFGENDGERHNISHPDVIYQRSQDIFVVDILNHHKDTKEQKESPHSREEWYWKEVVPKFVRAMCSHSNIKNKDEVDKLKTTAMNLNVTHTKNTNFNNINSRSGQFRLMQYCVDIGVDVDPCVKEACEKHVNHTTKIITQANKVVLHAEKQGHKTSRTHTKRDVFIQAAKDLKQYEEKADKNNSERYVHIKKLKEAAAAYQKSPRKFTWIKKRKHSKGYRELAYSIEPTVTIKQKKNKSILQERRSRSGRGRKNIKSTWRCDTKQSATQAKRKAVKTQRQDRTKPKGPRSQVN